MNSDEGLDTLMWLETLLPVSNWKRILYIGWHPHTFGKWGGDWYLNHIRGRTKGAEPVHTIIESCPAYAEMLRTHPVKRRFRIRIVEDDVTSFVRTCKDRFDVILWWHGPEHVEESQLAPTLEGLEALCDGAIVLGCPNGEDPYEDVEGGDKHRCIITDALLNDLGYQTRLMDRAWKEQQPAISAVRLCTKNRSARVPLAAL